MNDELSYWEKKRIEYVKGLKELEELIEWNLGEFERGCEDSENGMLSSKVKVGKKWYRKSDRRK